MIFDQAIIRRRAPLVVDAHGNERRDWANATDLPIRSVSVQPNSQNEDDTARRNSVVTGWRIQSAPGVDLDVLASDRIIVIDGGSIECSVVGVVARWPHPLTGAVHHVEFTVESVEG